MIKGCQKRIIQIKDTKSKLFEEAYFVLRCEINEPTIHSKDIINEATTVINSYSGEKGDSKSSPKKIRRFLWFLLGAASSFALSITAYFLFF